MSTRKRNIYLAFDATASTAHGRLDLERTPYGQMVALLDYKGILARDPMIFPPARGLVPLFCEEDDGHPFALNRAGLVEAYEGQRRLRGHSKQWEPLLHQGFICIVVENACRLHERATETGDMDHIRYTWRQLRRVMAWQTRYEAIPLEHRCRILRQLRKAGKAGGRPPLNRDAIVRDFDKMMAQGAARSMITQQLANIHNSSKAVINRILRESGRGLAKKCETTKKNM